MKPLTQLCSAVLLSITALLSSPLSSAENERQLSEAELEQILAPIALYPDSVLSHVLIAATYPLEVVQAERWVKANRDLTGEAALNAVENQDWEPSVKALVAFPQIVARMSEDLAWTQKLGEAFLADEEQVLDSIQTLRQRAYAAGNLDSLEHVKVEREAKTIVIEPAVREVVYIPYYDTRVVYGDWRWHSHPPVYWEYTQYYPNRYRNSHFYWSTGIRVQPRYVLSSFHWDRRHVVIVDLGHHHPSPYYWSSRHIIRHRDAHRWHHNPHHRRGAHYHHERLRRDYGRPSHPPRRHHEQHWADEPRRVPAGRYPHHVNPPENRATAPQYPASSVTPRRYGRHPNSDIGIIRNTAPSTSGNKQRLANPPTRVAPPSHNSQRAHPIRNSPQSGGGNRGGGRPNPTTSSQGKQAVDHLRSGGTINRLIRTGP